MLWNTLKSMGNRRLTLSGALMIMGLAGFFGLLVFYREAKKEWIGLVVMFVGAMAGYSRFTCPECLTQSAGIAVKRPAYCSACGHRMEAEASTSTPARDLSQPRGENFPRVLEES